MKKIYWATGVTLLGLVLTSCTSIFGAINVEEASYTLISVDGDFEVRKYDDMVVARTHVDEEYAGSSRKGFRRIAGYIFGKNVSKKNPKRSEEIAMTAPVFQHPDPAGWSMSFVMPSSYDLDSLPDPVDDSVVLKRVAGPRVAVLRYSGRLTGERIDEHAETLMAWIRETGHVAISEPYSAGYNPPWTIPMFRRNEVMVEIKP